MTVGDGNQINAKYKEHGEALASLADAIKHCAELDADDKMDAVADIDTVQAQLARSEPNTNAIRSAWAAIEPLAKVASLTNLIITVGQKLAPFIS